ncbi:hypothetical protein ACFL6G_04120 [candidate division KSB1 bacterium]
MTYGNNWSNIPHSNIDSDLVNSVLRQRLYNNLLLIEQVLTKISDRKLTHQELIEEIIKIEKLIMNQIKRWNFRRRMLNIVMPENLKSALETQLFQTKREKIKTRENTERDIAILEKELRQLWKEVFELITKLQFTNG